jgi:hypothetical protein
MSVGVILIEEDPLSAKYFANRIKDSIGQQFRAYFYEKSLLLFFLKTRLVEGVQ